MCVFQVNSLLVLTSCTKYILGLLQFHHDFLLDELQIHLCEFWNLDVSISTIWHAMKNAGLTWKKVCCLCMILQLCHAPSQLDLGEPSHTCIHLTTDHDSTQLNTPPHMGNTEYSLTQTSPTSTDISRQAGMAH